MQMLTSPTAAIWREAMAHPEIHRFPTQLSWTQEKPEMLAQRSLPTSARIPFRRQANILASSSSSTH